MSEFLPVFLQNALEDNETLLPEIASARTVLPRVLAFCDNYRIAAIGSLFLDGNGDEFRRRLAQSGRAFARYTSLPGIQLPLLSQARPLFDAIGAGDMGCAGDISTRLRREWARGEEYEEDHLFPEYVMQRFFLGATPEHGVGLLDRWALALQDSEDPRLDVCRALEARDATAFEGSLDRFLADEKAQMDEDAERGMAPEIAATERHLSTLGLALVRLAELVSLSVLAEYPRIPSLARGGAPPPPNSELWREVGA